jgi:DNA repair protein RAD57
MTDLLHVIPDFPTHSYTHLIPSLEKNLVTTADLLTLDVVDVAKRAQLPSLDLKRLIAHITDVLHYQLGINTTAYETSGSEEALSTVPSGSSTPRVGRNGSLKQWHTISTLDSDLDAELGGGIPTGYITEFAGER